MGIKSVYFSDHIILQVCLTMYEYMISLAERSIFIKAFLDEKEIEITKYYGEGSTDFDTDFEDYNDIFDFTSDNTKAPEEIMIWHFLKTITLEVEVCLFKNKKKQLKIMYFKKQPSAWFLTNESKEQLKEEIDLETGSSK